MVKAIWIAVFALAACASEEPRGDDDDNDDDSVEPLDSGQPPEDAGSVDAPSPDSEPAEDASLACTSRAEVRVADALSKRIASQGRGNALLFRELGHRASVHHNTIVFPPKTVQL